MISLGADGAWWLLRSSKPLRPDTVGLGGFDSHTFPPRSVALLPAVVVAVLLLVGAAPGRAPAQAVDSARVGPTAPVDSQPLPRDSVHRPPISPKHALLESLAIPGWGQASLHRSTAGGIFVALEVTSIAMLVQSKKELNAARELARDSVLVAGTGGYGANRFAGLIPTRKQAVEDWTALLIATHLFAAANAFVAAQLWDVPIEVHGQSDGQQALVSVRVPF